MNKTRVIVSVCVQTYNQEDYIVECLDGILMQKTNFPFEVILGEDESTDNTRAICKRYAEQFPEKIKLFLRSRKDVIKINGNATGRYNFIENLKACSGKYIALCEGDDYWTDPLKLQKQVDFLEANPNYGMCLHNVQQLNTFDDSKNTIIPNVITNTDISLNEYVLSNRTATCSIMFKSTCFFPIQNWFKKLPFGDLGLILSVLKACNGKAHVLSDCMGVYRIHEKGIHGNLHKNNSRLIKAYKQHIQFTRIIKNELLKERTYKTIIFKKYINTYKVLAKLYKTENQKFSVAKSNLFKKYYNIMLNRFS